MPVSCHGSKQEAGFGHNSVKREKDKLRTVMEIRSFKEIRCAINSGPLLREASMGLNIRALHYSECAAQLQPLGGNKALKDESNT